MKNDIIRVSGAVEDSIVDGDGIRYTLFVQGCPHHCPGCHNPQTHDFSGGEDKTVGDVLKVVAQNPLLSGITLSGGEPFCQAAPLAALAAGAHSLGLDVWVYSGFTLEQLLELAKEDGGVRELLKNCDVLVDGLYIEAERDLTLSFRGSRNQRIIDLHQQEID